jgi:nicotinic acid mononucleotide adenylyltransferase
MGSDEASSFGKWKNPEEILKLAKVVSVMRPGQNSPIDPRIEPLEVPLLNISSTRLREILSKAKYDDPVVSEWLTEPVLDYIKSHALYVG